MNDDHANIGIPVMGRVKPACTCDKDVYAEMGKLVNRVVALERNVDAIIGKLEEFSVDLEKLYPPYERP